LYKSKYQGSFVFSKNKYKMKITITGSLGHIGKPLTKKLVAAGHQVTVISHSEERKAAIEALGAKAAIGSVSDAAFLTKVLTGAEAVFAMTPPAMGGSNIIANTVNAGKAYATAFKQLGTPRVIMLSSIGADLPDKNGPIAAIHQIEKIYSGIDGTAFRFLRAGYFYTNFLNDIPLIQGAGIIGGNFPANTRFPLAHYEDIARIVAEELQKPFTGKEVRFVMSDVRTPADIAAKLGAAIGNPQLPWVEFTDEQALAGLTQAGVPAELAGLFVEMGAGFRSGRLLQEYEQNGSPVIGSVKLEDFAKEFATRFKTTPVS
jgi:uncharacterized protein YbjT (DUF2867 family)